ncbi:hypothetical protein [Saccharopolyspora shandongensis]|uniref:hypothetical protein n=1 Tax=Saccharopolyspora shandongensis TaxID=418495 RepID=UPI0033C9F378
MIDSLLGGRGGVTPRCGRRAAAVLMVATFGLGMTLPLTAVGLVVVCGRDELLARAANRRRYVLGPGGHPSSPPRPVILGGGWLPYSPQDAS